MQIQSYESNRENVKTSEEEQEISNEFLKTVAGDSILDNVLDKYTDDSQERADYIHEKHKKQIRKCDRKNKRKIKMAKAFEKSGKIFLSKSLLELSMKKYGEVLENRASLKQKMDAEWQEWEEHVSKNSKRMKSSLGEIIDEIVIAERMNTTEKHKRRTNEELEDVLGEERLYEAIQDKHGIGNIFQTLINRFSKKDERGER